MRSEIAYARGCFGLQPFAFVFIVLEEIAGQKSG
jgi:hypothetical protein